MRVPRVISRLCLKRYSSLLRSVITGYALAICSFQCLASVTDQTGTIIEPQTPGIFYLIDAQGKQIALEYKVAKANSILFSIEGDKSPVRIADGAHVRLLVRLPAGVDAASAMISFFQFEPKNDHRSIEFELFKQRRRLKRPPMAVVPFDAVTAGSSSVVLTPQAPLRPGEYCAGMGKNTKEAYCFGVDDVVSVQSIAQGNEAGISGGPPVARGNAGGATMTNADVVKMVTAGLSQDVVIGSIRQANGRGFDLSVDGLINLKKNKVPDAVVTAMQKQVTEGSSVASIEPPPSTSSPSSLVHPNGPIPVPPDESTFYYVTSSGKLGKLEKLRADQILEAQLSHRNETGWKVFGSRAGVRFPNGDVTLVVKLYGKFLIFDAGHEDSIRFRRWEPSSGARETWYSARPPNRYRQKTLEQGEFEFTAAKIGENTYKIAPNEPLIPGEYCASTGDYHVQYCFGVDGAR